MQFFGHPCGRPKDICAHLFILSWETENHKVPSKYKVYKDISQPIFHVEYQCLGQCNTEALESGQDTSDSEQNLDEDGDNNNQDKKEAHGLDQLILEKENPKARHPNLKTKMIPVSVLTRSKFMCVLFSFIFSFLNL
jgi:hypothetical protein